MREWIGSAALLIVVALVVLRPWEEDPDSGPRSVTTEVVRVIDGDTVEAWVGGAVEDVRLIGIDTPETVKPGEPVQCFGRQASSFAHRLLQGRRVRLVFGRERRDRYGRMLAYLYLANSTSPGPGAGKSRPRSRLFNAVLVRRGLARTLTIPPNDRFAPHLRRLELTAARTGRGLWGACAP